MKVIAILCSDLHLSETAPVARAAEPDWFAAQERPLAEIDRLSKKHRCPVIIAGDIFDRWNASPAIINFALEHLPDNVYAIPGQHDLPNHSLKEIKRSAYWTLVESGKVINIDYRVVDPLIISGWVSRTPGTRLIVRGFSWGQKITPEKCLHNDGHVYLAVSHQYVFTRPGINGNGYPGAPEDQMLSKMWLQLEGYDAAVFGDNHQGFLAGSRVTGKHVNVMNCGTLMRRKQDERDYKPQVGLLRADVTIDRHFLDVSKDKFSDPTDVSVDRVLDSSEFLEELRSLGGDSLDFRAAILRRLDKVSDDVRCAVLEAVGE